MTTYTRPVTSGTPTTGQVVKAAHVNEPIDQIYDTILAGGITSDQIAAGAVDTSELATEAVTAAKMDGTLPDASAMATSAAPTTDAQLANKKYVDDSLDDSFSPTTESGILSSTGVTVFRNGFRIARGKDSVNSNSEKTITPSGFTIIYNAQATWQESNSTDRFPPKISTPANTTFKIRNTNASSIDAYWLCIGR